LRREAAMYNVLHDFTIHVKTAGYLTAAVLLILIVPFWLYLTGGEKKKK
jgi:hypothetical protein